MSVQSAALTLPADRTRTLRALGAAGVGGGLLFAAMSSWEHAADPTGTANALNQGGFALAMVGYVAMLIGVHVARPGGDGRIARISTALVAAAWLALLAGIAVEAVTSLDVLGAVGGVAQAIGLVGAGITTARAGRWSGWRRYAPLALAVVYVGALFVPAVAGSEPSALTETVWALGYSGLGLALVVEQGWLPSRGQSVLGGLVAAAAITVAALVTFSSPSASASVVPEPSSAVVVHGPVGASANNLEHAAGAH